MKLLYLNPAELEPDPQGTRDEPGNVDGLAATIAEQGLLQPLGVIATGKGQYRIVYGNRRRAAAIQLGLEKVPCILLDAEDQDVLLGQLVENIQRQELNDIEKARAFSRLRARIAEVHGKESEGELDDATGKAVGLTGRTVRRYLGLLELPQEVQFLIRRGELNVTQAQHLRRIPNPLTQIELARAAAEEGMSAADLSRLAGYFIANPNLTLETALQVLEQGGIISDRGGPEITVKGEPHGSFLDPGAFSTDEREESDADLWDDDDLAENDQSDDPYLRVEDDLLDESPSSRKRLARIRSLDQMVDETDRLSRAYAEGDLVKWASKDQSAPFKMRLLLKQLESLVGGLRDIVSRQGWENE
jgi:ParB family chromosome partitioning protein